MLPSSASSSSSAPSCPPPKCRNPAGRSPRSRWLRFLKAKPRPKIAGVNDFSAPRASCVLEVVPPREVEPVHHRLSRTAVAERAFEGGGERRRQHCRHRDIDDEQQRHQARVAAHGGDALGEGILRGQSVWHLHPSTTCNSSRFWSHSRYLAPHLVAARRAVPFSSIQVLLAGSTSIMSLRSGSITARTTFGPPG